MNKERWFHVNMDNACFGFACNKDSVIIKVPPLISWMMGKSLQEVKPFFLKNKAVISEIK